MIPLLTNLLVELLREAEKVIMSFALIIGLGVTCAVLIGLFIWSQVTLRKERDEKEALKKDLTAQMSTTTAEVQAQLTKLRQLEQSNTATQQTLTTSRGELEAKSQQLQVLRDTVARLEKDNEVKSKELAEARKAVFETSDYILDRYIGKDKTQLLQLRRIRDTILVNLANARKTGCKMLKDNKSYQRFLEALPQLKELSTAQQLKNPTNQNLHNYINTAARLCTDPTKPLIKMILYQYLSIDASSIVDELDKLVLDLRDKACPKGVPDFNFIENVFLKFNTLICDESSEAPAMLSHPLDYALAKTVSLFQ